MLCVSVCVCVCVCFFFFFFFFKYISYEKKIRGNLGTSRLVAWSSKPSEGNATDDLAPNVILEPLKLGLNVKAPKSTVYTYIYIYI
jgi:hypothetical protein